MCIFEPRAVMKAANQYVNARELKRDDFVRSLSITTQRYDTLHENPRLASSHELQSIVEIVGRDLVERCELDLRPRDTATPSLFPESVAA